MARTAAIRELLSLLDEQDRFLHSRKGAEFAARQLAAGGLGRARALLAAICLLMEQGRSDVIGILTRAIFEVCTVCLYLLSRQKQDGTNPAVAELMADHAFRLGQISDRLGVSGPEVDRQKALSKEKGADGKAIRLPRVDQMAERVSEFVATDPLGGIGSWQLLYATVYKGESTFGTHPGFVLLQNYLLRDGDLIRPNPNPGAPYADQEKTAAGLTIYLAYHVLKEFGAEVDPRLDAIAGQIGMDSDESGGAEVF